MSVIYTVIDLYHLVLLFIIVYSYIYTYFVVFTIHEVMLTIISATKNFERNSLVRFCVPKKPQHFNLSVHPLQRQVCQGPSHLETQILINLRTFMRNTIALLKGNFTNKHIFKGKNLFIVLSHFHFLELY